jgi:hypothetical protein
MGNRSYHGDRTRENKRKAARARAEKALTRRYPAQFTELYEAELEKAGLLPRLKPGPPAR